MRKQNSTRVNGNRKGKLEILEINFTNPTIKGRDKRKS